MHGKVKMSSYDIPDEPELNRLTDFFKVLGDPTRVKILFRLFQSENCVGELAEKCRLQNLPYLISCMY